MGRERARFSLYMIVGGYLIYLAYQMYQNPDANPRPMVINVFMVLFLVIGIGLLIGIGVGLRIGIGLRVVVGGAVVYEDHLVCEVICLHHAFYPRVEFGERFLLVEQRNYYCYIHDFMVLC